MTYGLAPPGPACPPTARRWAITVAWVAGEKYIRALPVAEWLDRLDGLLLTGAVSNIEPQHYGGAPSWPGNPHDPARDATALLLVYAALGGIRNDV